jgi:hypothetical protein
LLSELRAEIASRSVSSIRSIEAEAAAPVPRAMAPSAVEAAEESEADGDDAGWWSRWCRREAGVAGDDDERDAPACGGERRGPIMKEEGEARERSGPAPSTPPRLELRPSLYGTDGAGRENEKPSLLSPYRATAEAASSSVGASGRRAAGGRTRGCEPAPLPS